MGMTSMLKHFQLKLEGRHHSGIDDCRNITKCLAKMIEEGIDSDLLQPTTDFSRKEEVKPNRSGKPDADAVLMLTEKAKPFIGDKVFGDVLRLEKTDTTNGRERALGVLTHHIVTQLKKQDDAFSKISIETRKSFLAALKSDLVLPYLKSNCGWP